MSRPHTYEGVRCYGKGLFVGVSAYSGAIRSFANYPVVVPSSMDQRLSSEQAQLAALAFLRTRFTGGRLDREGHAELAIIHPNGCWSDKTSLLPAGEPRLSWLVGFVHSPDDSTRATVTVYVDCASGEIIGGMNK